MYMYMLYGKGFKIAYRSEVYVEVDSWKRHSGPLLYKSTIEIHVLDSTNAINFYVDVDTSLTEKEVEAMVDQTAMELLVKDAMEKLKVIGQEAIAAQQKAAGAIKAHVEQLKTALAQSKQSGSLKDLSEVVLNSQKVATDCVAAAKAAQVIKYLNCSLIFVAWLAQNIIHLMAFQFFLIILIYRAQFYKQYLQCMSHDATLLT